ncbi:MAG: hypothetical protein KatS3mg126_1815 [Lysobacteraceae bacterium]|nr:MAG: hypothetical protein KatS3mg126_1815 [Xanthomonadaceae bacterium]
MSDPAIESRIAQRIALEIDARPAQVAAAVALLDGGATVPFVARYRKEATGGLDDTQLRKLEERLAYLRELEARRAAILQSIAAQGKLDAGLRASIEEADSKARLEDLYLPYRPRRRTRAQIAREAGLEPLAEALLADPGLDPERQAAGHVDAARGVADARAALDGARAILLERWSEDADLLGALRDWLGRCAVVRTRVVEGKQDEGAKYRDYFDHAEPLARIPSHRLLALLRARREEVVSLEVEPGPDPEAGHAEAEARICAHVGIADRGRPADRWLREAVRLCWKARLHPTLALDLVGSARERAEAEAIEVFAANLKDLLLAAPAGARTVLGLDPGLRTGVKVAVVDPTGKVLDTATVHPHEPRRQWDAAIACLHQLCARHGVELVAIGNGTASRETERLVDELIRRHPEPRLQKVVVSEAGASVYSASELAARELPDLDVSLRGAVSIARRLQDPLAELVKIEPKAIGVGQYQHDVNPFALARALDAKVEDCVNAVGVELNTASAALLARVSGLSPLLAENIVRHRDTHGPFRSRRALLDVPRLGEKTFEQCAGFLRIRDGEEPLDASAVHPEAYPVVERIARACGRPVRSLIGDTARTPRDPRRGLHRRPLRPAYRARHPARAGEAGPRPPPGVSHRALRRGHRDARRPAPGHGAGGRGHQRRRVRRLRRHRRAPGRADPRLCPGRPLRPRPPRGGAGRRPRHRPRPRGRSRTTPHRAEPPPRRRSRRRSLPQPERAARQAAPGPPPPDRPWQRPSRGPAAADSPPPLGGPRPSRHPCQAAPGRPPWTAPATSPWP